METLETFLDWETEQRKERLLPIRPAEWGPEPDKKITIDYHQDDGNTWYYGVLRDGENYSFEIESAHVYESERECRDHLKNYLRDLRKTHLTHVKVQVVPGTQRTRNGKLNLYSEAQTKGTAISLLLAANSYIKVADLCFSADWDFWKKYIASFQQVLFAAELSMKLMLILESDFSYFPQEQKHDLSKLFATIRNRSDTPKRLQDFMLSIMNEICKSEKIQRISKNELLSAIERNRVSHVNLRYFGVDPKGVSKGFRVNPRDIEIIKCLALALFRTILRTVLGCRRFFEINKLDEAKCFIFNLGLHPEFDKKTGHSINICFI